MIMFSFFLAFWCINLWVVQRNIQQLEFELKTNGRNKDEKCFKKLDNYESRKPESEMKVEEVNRIPKDKVTSVSHESPKPLSSNCTKPKYITTSTSYDQQKKSCSLLYLIVFALFMTFFLGRYWAIVLTLSWLYSVPYQSHYVQLSHFSPKLGFLCFSNPQRRNPVRGGTADLIFRATGNALKSSESKWKVITENIKLLTWKEKFWREKYFNTIACVTLLDIRLVPAIYFFRSDYFFNFFQFYFTYF